MEPEFEEPSWKHRPGKNISTHTLDYRGHTIEITHDHRPLATRGLPDLINIEFIHRGKGHPIEIDNNLLSKLLPPGTHTAMIVETQDGQKLIISNYTRESTDKKRRLTSMSSTPKMRENLVRFLRQVITKH